MAVKHAFQKTSEFGGIRNKEKIAGRRTENYRSLLDVWQNHAIIFMLAMGFIAYLFNANFTWITYVAITALIIWLAHFAHFHKHKTYDEVIIVGFFFAPILLVFALFGDLFSLIIFGVYIVSLVTTMVIYYYHGKKHDISKTMVQVTYSNMIGLAAALFAAYMIQFALNGFFSIPEIVLAFALPVFALHFTISKYMYLHFFDKTHWVRDLKKALIYGLLFSLLFTIITAALYAGIVHGFVKDRIIQDEAVAEIDEFASSLKETYQSLDPKIRELEVIKEAESAVDKTIQDIDELKAEQERIRKKGIDMEDSHFIDLRNSAIAMSSITLKEYANANIKQLLIEAYDEFSGSTDEELENALLVLKSSVDGNPFLTAHVLQQPSYSVNAVMSNDITPEELASLVKQEPGVLASIFTPKKESPFVEMHRRVFQHTVLYREIARLVILFSDLRGANVYEVIPVFYSKRDIEESLLSKTIRYSVLNTYAENIRTSGY